MPKFCTGCGTQLNDNAKFCPNCGAAQGDAPAPDFTRPVYAEGGAGRPGVPAPGFSARVNDPEILAAVKKTRKASGIFAFFIVPLPLIGFLIYSAVSDKMETADALKYGAIVSAVFLVFAIYSFIKSRAKNTYDATVTDKKTRLAYRNGDSNYSYTEYVTIARTDGGKKKKIVEHEGSQTWAWDYLPVGARFRYHPQFNFPYELYDKSSAPYIACVSCSTQNDVTAERCKSCNLPLLK